MTRLVVRWTGGFGGWSISSGELVGCLRGKAGNTDHCCNQIQGPHPDADILITDASEDSVLIFGNQVRVGRDNLDHCEKSDVFYCKSSRIMVLLKK